MSAAISGRVEHAAVAVRGATVTEKNDGNRSDAGGNHRPNQSLPGWGYTKLERRRKASKLLSGPGLS